MKKTVGYLLIAFSFLLASLYSVYLYSAPPTCVSLWNLCQEMCQGMPSLLVMGDGSQGVLCDFSQAPCPEPNWRGYPCVGS